MFSMEIDTDLSLALVQPSFAEEYYSIVTEQVDYLSQWLAWPIKADSIEFFSVFIALSLKDYEDEKSMICAIRYKDKVIGSIGFNKLSKKLKKVEIGYWLSREHQGQGIIHKSVKKLLTYAFNQLEMEIAQISVATENLPSRKVCEGLGFSLDGVVKNSENLNGRIVDHAIYSMSKGDWSD